MKRAFFLIEVIISIVLISGVIIALFEVKSNNLHFIEKFKDNKDLYSVISIFALNNKKVDNQNQNLYFKDLVSFETDEIRIKFKEIKVNLVEKKISDKDVSDEKVDAGTFSVNVEKYESSYSVPNKLNKKIYTIKLF